MSTCQNILITGASSVLMQDLIEKIDKKKFKIWAVTRDRLKIKNSEIGVLQGDICSPIFVNSIIKDKKIDIVIHAAAVTHTFQTQNYFDVNFQSTMHLVNASKNNNVSKFVFISSRTAGKQSGAYGFSKLQAEEFIKTNFGNYLIIRPPEVFGGNKNEGIDKLIQGVFQKKIILCPVNLKSKLYPIYNSDAIQIIFNLIFNTPPNSKLITFSGKEGFSYYELICKIGKAINKKIFIIPVPKFVMFTIKWIVEFFRMEIGFVPDQVPRLYSHKETGIQYNTMTIDEYVIGKKQILEKLFAKK